MAFNPEFGAIVYFHGQNDPSSTKIHSVNVSDLESDSDQIGPECLCRYRGPNLTAYREQGKECLVLYVSKGLPRKELREAAVLTVEHQELWISLGEAIREKVVQSAPDPIQHHDFYMGSSALSGPSEVGRPLHGGDVASTSNDGGRKLLVLLRKTQLTGQNDMRQNGAVAEEPTVPIINQSQPSTSRGFDSYMVENDTLSLYTGSRSSSATVTPTYDDQVSEEIIVETDEAPNDPDWIPKVSGRKPGRPPTQMSKRPSPSITKRSRRVLSSKDWLWNVAEEIAWVKRNLEPDRRKNITDSELLAEYRADNHTNLSDGFLKMRLGKAINEAYDKKDSGIVRTKGLIVGIKFKNRGHHSSAPSG